MDILTDNDCWALLRTVEVGRLAVIVDVAFESDGADTDVHQAWSVQITGTVDEIRDLDGLVEACLLPLAPWPGGPKHRFLRIVPGRITGRRFTVVDGSGWRDPYTLRRTPTFE